jgi:hypothetical protein
MSFTSSSAPTETPFPSDTPRSHPQQRRTNEDLNEVLWALEISFDAILVQWRVMEWGMTACAG